MDLSGALAANTSARSVERLSQSPLFRCRHASAHDTIDVLQNNPGHSPIDGPRRQLEERLLLAVIEEVPAPACRPFWLLGLDSLSLARPPPTRVCFKIAATSTRSTGLGRHP